MTIFSGRGLTSIYTMLFRMLKEECSKEKFKLNHSPIEDFTNCLWQRQPNILPVWIAYRLILFLYFFTTFGVIVFLRPERGFIWYKNMLYVGYWAYLAEVFAFGLAFVVTLEKFLRDKKKVPKSPPREDTSDIPLREKTPWHYKILWFLYTMIASSALSVTTMFWCFLYDPDGHVNIAFCIVSRISNSFFLVLDVFLNAIPFRFLHLYIPCTFPLIYIIFTVIYQTSGGTGNRGLIPIYPTWDWRKPKQVISTAAIFLAFSILFHCVLCVINIFKNWFKKPSESAE